MRPFGLTLLGLVTLPVIVAATEPLPPAASRHACAPAEPQLATGAAHAGFQRLDKLPPASAVLLVDREIDGCPAPLVVRTGIGSTPHQPSPPKR